MTEPYPRIVNTSDDASASRCNSSSNDEEDARELFRLQVMEDLEEERGLLYKFVAAVETILLVILLRQIIINVLN